MNNQQCLTQPALTDLHPNMVTGINESKILTKHLSCECKCKFDATKLISNQKWKSEKCWCECKNPKKLDACEKVYIWNPSIWICKNGEYSESTIDDSVITCDAIVNAEDSVLTNGSAYVMSTVSTYFHNNKERYRMDCYILYTVILMIILLFIIAIICLHYAKHRSKQKKHIAVLTI